MTSLQSQIKNLKQFYIYLRAGCNEGPGTHWNRLEQVDSASTKHLCILVAAPLWLLISTNLLQWL